MLSPPTRGNSISSLFCSSAPLVRGAFARPARSRLAEVFGHVGQLLFQLGRHQFRLPGSCASSSIFAASASMAAVRACSSSVLQRDQPLIVGPPVGRDSAPARRSPARRNSRAAESDRSDGRGTGRSRPSAPTGADETILIVSATTWLAACSAVSGTVPVASTAIRKKPVAANRSIASGDRFL